MVDDVMAKPAVTQVAAPAATRAAPLVRWWWAVALAAGAGFVLLVAFPTFDQWWTAPIGVALLGLAVHRRGFWAGLGLGTITGLCLLIPLLSWAGGVVGPVWLILPCAFSLYLGVMGGLSALLSPVVDRWRWIWPLATGSLWVLQEALRDRTPFGGFPWGRLAFSQDGSPLLHLASIGGAPLVTFSVAALGGLLACAVVSLPIQTVADLPAHKGASQEDSRRGLRSMPRRHAVVPAVAALALTWVPLAIPAPAGEGASGAASYTVAIVQGNVPRLGLDFNAQRRAVLENHVQGTLRLADEVATGRAARPDVVVWPENASDVDPFLDQTANARIAEAARAIGVPILVGGVLQGPGPKQVRNAGIVWDPRTGPGQMYLKRHPVPFAEYIPLRTLARMITDKVDLVRSDFVAGSVPGVLGIPRANASNAVLGDVICFEVAYDEVVRDTVTNGAELLVVQTNNATFNESEARQQLAMVRLRAVEHGRSALMASTVGISAVVDPSGGVQASTSFNVPDVIVRTVALREARTMATALGPLPELALVAAALALLVLALANRRRWSAEQQQSVAAEQRRAVS